MTSTSSSVSSRVSSLEFNRIKTRLIELEYNHAKMKEFILGDICEDCRVKLLRKLEEDEK